MNKIQLVERHIVVNSKEYQNLCWLSKNLYNKANYSIRQSFINTGKLPSEFEITTKFASRNNVDYRALPSQTSQQIIKLLYKNWKSFFASVKEYKKNPSKFLGKPKLPKYKDKDGQNILVFTNQQCRLKEGKILFPKSTGLTPIKSKAPNLQQLRIIPQATCFVVEVVYNSTCKDELPDNNRYLSLDLGLNNFATSINNIGLEPFIINGKGIKSINQYYNKVTAKQQSNKQSNHKITLWRNNKIQDYTHKTSRFIVDYAISNNINTVIVGNNKNWKQEINIGKRNNQNFVSIPHTKLIQQLEYKCLLAGIKLEITEESYTSKVDHLANEGLHKHEKYLGKRVKRGLFKSSVGRIINADCNGAIGIFRKVVTQEIFQQFLSNSGQVSRPYKISFK